MPKVIICIHAQLIHTFESDKITIQDSNWRNCIVFDDDSISVHLSSTEE